MGKYIISKPPKNGPPDFEAEWIPNKPNQRPTQRLERIMGIQNTKQYNELRKIPMPEQIPEPKLTKIYARKDGQWQQLGYKCLDCGKPMSNQEVAEKHRLLCKVDKKINKKDLEEKHILSRIGNRDIEEEYTDPFAELEEDDAST